MAQRAILDALWCGQGMSNVLRVFRDDSADPTTTAADWLCVFDFGSGGLSASKKVLGITPPVSFLIDQLKLQIAAGRDPVIDVMLISHQDRDHWLLLSELDKQLNDQKIALKVGRILLAGENWRQSSTDALLKYAKRTADIKTCVTNYTAESSNYMAPLIGVGSTLSIGDVTLRMLVTNVATSKSLEDIERNCSSAIVLLQLGPFSFILPGDATWETLSRLKTIMSGWSKNPLPSVYAASVPHHGAERTMSRSASTVDLQDLVWFTGYTRPTSIFASAGYYNTHSHPYLSVLDAMGRYTLAQQFHERPIVVFNGKKSAFEVIPKQQRNIYTSVMNLTTPVRSANWIFNITPNTNSTGVQVFDAGVPGILLPPQTNPMQLVADLVNANAMDTSIDIENDTHDAMFLDVRYEPIRWGPTTTYTGGAMKPSCEPAPLLFKRVTKRRYERPAPPPRRVHPCIS
ncbi:ComEC/Rec2 family competence protein [Pseudomonas veronii]|uniref:hypothetical protein n=1 Tax=Pseudomonas veronii TaxID=76761 RepID=UPI0021C0CFB7|nr:hypothetical protein [Pseudomonas veronii]MCT9825451.1 hypothetical protein [Pseudomonas veronii]